MAIHSEKAATIQLNHVGFHYPARPNQQALKDFTLRLLPGECVALVGPSGAGKSTVMQLLLRFYDPQEGDITVGVSTSPCRY